MVDAAQPDLGEDKTLLLVDDDEPFLRRLAKAMEKRESGNDLYMYQQSRPVVRRQARKMMEPWAKALRKGLDRAREETGAD